MRERDKREGNTRRINLEDGERRREGKGSDEGRHQEKREMSKGELRNKGQRV